jgi:hypothetical protein
VAGHDVSTNAVRTVLQKLTPTESRILRPVATGGLPGFEIFHDVLALPVLEWKRAFQDGIRREEQLAEAEAKYQIELAQAEAKRQAETIDLRRKEAVRRLRLVGGAAAIAIMFAITAAAAAYYAYRQETLAVRANAAAQRALGEAYWSRLDFTTRALTAGEIDTLWKIANSSGDVKDGFLIPLTLRPDPAIIVTFGRRPQPVMRAIGLNWPPAGQVPNLVTGFIAIGQALTDPARLLFWARALSAMPTTLTTEQSSQIFGWMLPMFPATSDLTQLTTLVSALTALPVTTTGDQAQQALTPIVKVLTTPSATRASLESSERQRLATVAGSLADRLTATQATSILELLLDSAVGNGGESTDNVSRIDGAVLQLAESASKRLSAEQMHPIVEPIIQQLVSTVSAERIRTLTAALASVAHLSAVDAQAAIDVVSKALRTTLETDRTRALIVSLGKLLPSLPQFQAQANFDRDFNELTKRVTAPGRTSLVVDMVKALPGSLNDQQAMAAFRAVQQPLLSREMFPEYPTAATAMVQLGPAFGPSQAQSVYPLAMADFSAAETDFAIRARAIGVRVIAANLTPRQAQAVMQLVVKYSAASTNAWAQVQLTRIMATLPVVLTDKDASVLSKQFIRTLTSPQDTTDSDILAEPARNLAGKLTVPQLQQTLTSVQSMDLTGAPASAVSAVAEIFQHQLTVRQAADAGFENILRLLEATTNEDERLMLFQMLRQAAQQLDPEHAEPAFKATLAALVKGIGPPRNRFLLDALQLVKTKLQGAQVEAMLAATLVSARVELAPIAADLAKRLDAAPSPDTMDQLRIRLAAAGDENAASAWADAIAAAARFEPPDTFARTIVEVLKYPTAGGEPTNTLLLALRSRYPGERELDGNLYEVVPWLRRQLGPATVDSPPIRPGSRTPRSDGLER